MNDTKAQIKAEFPEILLDEDLSKYSTFMIGGSADYFYKVESAKKLVEIINFSQKHRLPYLIIGGGSNILFDDKGFSGIIIQVQAQNLSVKNDEITADAGVKIGKLIHVAMEYNLSGLEKWLGLPGTVGGAVRGNAGCNGLETKDILTRALVLNPDTGEVKKVDREYFEFEYRHSKIKDSKEIVLQATFKLEKDKLSKEEQDKIFQEIQKFRLTKQPFGKSSGSFFKNPSPEKPAGMLIDQAGLKGKSIGKAQISEKHGNFFLNTGGATSSEMIELAKLAKHEVKAKFGIDLKEEVQIISENGSISL